MGSSSKVIWSEGMFLQQHHFQQYDRYLHRQITQKPGHNKRYDWGIEELSFDSSCLGLGQLIIKNCRAIMPDGTLVDIPNEDLAPSPLIVEEGIVDCVVYLALAISSYGIPESAYDNRSYRYHIDTLEVQDNINGAHASGSVQIGHLNFKLLFEHDSHAGYVTLPIARVQEVRPDGELILDASYIPPCLHIDVNNRLFGLVREVEGLLDYRASMLIERISGEMSHGVAGVGGVNDFMLLQVVSRYAAILDHILHAKDETVRAVFLTLLELASELAIFTQSTKRFEKIYHYNHLKPEECFLPLVNHIKRCLSVVLEESALSFGLQAKQSNIWSTEIHDKTLLTRAMFVLAVQANVSTETIVHEFPAQTKVAPVEEISQLVSRALPGIELYQLQVPPRQIPYHSNQVYFSLKTIDSELWRRLAQSAGLAIHVGGQFPGLKMALWAIKH